MDTTFYLVSAFAYRANKNHAFHLLTFVTTTWQISVPGEQGRTITFFSSQEKTSERKTLEQNSRTMFKLLIALITNIEPTLT